MSVKKELVSVILPTYNRKNVVKRAVLSVLEQSYQNWELIIVDDGSTDGTEDVVMSSVENYNIKYIYQVNQGVSAARNRGVAEAKGNYIAFIDSDDEWDSRKLANQIDFFNENPGVGLVFCNAIIINSDGSRSDKPELISHTGNTVFTFKEVFDDPYLGIPTVMVTSELFNSVNGFDEKLKTSEDIDFYLKASLIQPFGYLHDKLVNIYKIDGSLTSSIIGENTILPYEDIIYVLERFVECNKRQVVNSYNCNVNLSMFNIYLSYGRALLQKGMGKAAREKFILARSYKKNLESLYLLLKSYLPQVKRCGE